VSADCQVAETVLWPTSEKIERDIEQLELALEDLLVAVAEGDDDHHR